MPIDTLFTKPPEWEWLIVLYFFLGGIAGGSYFLGALIDLFGEPEDHALSRLAYFVAFPAVLLCAPLLILDLNRPERFWHMMFQSERFPLPIFKWWSPMSVGSWALLVFGGFALASFLGSLVEVGVIRWGAAQQLNTVVRRGRLSGIFAMIGAGFGFFLASYTGVLLSVTNRPIWADTSLLGLLFLTSAGSTAAALLILLSWMRVGVSPYTVGWLKRLDGWALLMELGVLILVVLSLGQVARLWLNVWGGVLALGVVGLGILVPLLLHWRPQLLGRLSIPMASVLVLMGGFLLRVVMVLSSESVHDWTLYR